MSDTLSKAPKNALLTIFSIIVIDLIGFGIVIPILPFYAESYGANATVLGLLLTSYALMQFLFAPLWGKLSDKIGRRPVLLMTIFGSSLALLALGLAPSLSWLFVARILGGFFGANISVATAYVTDVTSDEERSKGMGLIGAAFGIGFILGPALGGLLSSEGQYSLPMFFASAMALVNLLYCFIILKEPPRLRHPDDLKVSRIKILANVEIRRMCFTYFMYTFSIAQLETVFAFLMLDRFGYNVRQVAYILVFMALIMVAIQGGGIRQLAKRFGEKNLAISGAVLLLLSFALIPSMGSVLLLLIPLGISSIGRGISQPSLLSLVSYTSDRHNRGSVMGAFQSSASLARVLGPIVAGLLYDQAMGYPFYAAALGMGFVAVMVNVTKNR
jgi:MFS transporter, DHA1 family, tetracycline resistance protein